MSECQVCHCEDAIPSFVLEICEDCYDEMKMESQAAGQDFYEYWEIDDEVFHAQLESLDMKPEDFAKEAD